MIVCRSLSSVVHLWRSVNVTEVLSKPRVLFQSRISYHRLVQMRNTGKMKAKVCMEKQRTAAPVWRPICIQSSSSEEYTVETESELGNPYCKDIEVTTDVSVSMTSTSGGTENEIQIEYVEAKQTELSVMDSRLNSQTIKKDEFHSATVQVDASLIRFIKGKGGSMQRKIEAESGVKIVFPSSREDNYISIEGVSVENVTKASEKIHDVLEEVVQSPSLDYSHFISLPLAINTELVDKLNNFQNSILGDVDANQNGNVNSSSNEDCLIDEDDKDFQPQGDCNVSVALKVQDDKEHVGVSIKKVSYKPKSQKSLALEGMGIDRSIFIKPKTFHLTVLMLKLWNKERVATATNVLQSISSKVVDALDGRPVSLRLKGLDCMKGSPAKARVLYVPVEEIGGEGRLLRACKVITDAYVEAGLVLDRDAHQTLKLHATVMNARHRKRKSWWNMRFDTFDARDIIKKYGTEDWGEYLIRETHLSQRFAFDESGYFHCCTSIPFPENMQIE
ncbi:hypothetical protein QJS10_CPB18g01083 [Acorus calamus]|uniref:K Homology domain-containing protein n=1 Tax=Acorus calamus TaxID=4465 RepID=A0AAV9CPJ8_ACOCL|nr:hypothetical protein QJS10_CPB18g01083 [Acorus calamus]